MRAHGIHKVLRWWAFEHLLGAGLSALLATEELCVGDMRSSLLTALEQLRALARLHPKALPPSTTARECITARPGGDGRRTGAHPREESWGRE
jgi:hypothetical protein